MVENARPFAAMRLYAEESEINPSLAQLQYVAVDADLRIYYKPIEPAGSGFYGAFIELVGDSGGWDHPDSLFENAGFVTAYF